MGCRMDEAGDGRQALEALRQAPYDRFQLRRWLGRPSCWWRSSAFNRAIIKARLAEWGMQVIEAEHGLEALGVLDAGARPAAILMDMDMPGLDGVEATRAPRASMSGSVRDVSVLALTGHSSQERSEAASAAGMNGFLTKPVDPDTLRRELIRVLGNSMADAVPSAPATTAAHATIEHPPHR